MYLFLPVPGEQQLGLFLNLPFLSLSLVVESFMQTLGETNPAIIDCISVRFGA